MNNTTDSRESKDHTDVTTGTMQLIPFYVVISVFAVAITIPCAWRLLQLTLSKANTRLLRCEEKLYQSTMALVTDFSHEHVEITHDVWQSVSVCSNLVTDLHNLGNQSATPKQKRVCFPKIDDDLADRIAQPISDMH